MRPLVLLFFGVFLASCETSPPSSDSVVAHGGGLNACGCHFNRKTGVCHCHRDRGCGCACEPSRCKTKKPSAADAITVAMCEPR